MGGDAPSSPSSARRPLPFVGAMDMPTPDPPGQGQLGCPWLTALPLSLLSSTVCPSPPNPRCRRPWWDPAQRPPRLFARTGHEHSRRLASCGMICPRHSKQHSINFFEILLQFTRFGARSKCNGYCVYLRKTAKWWRSSRRCKLPSKVLRFTHFFFGKKLISGGSMLIAVRAACLNLPSTLFYEVISVLFMFILGVCRFQQTHAVVWRAAGARVTEHFVVIVVCCSPMNSTMSFDMQCTDGRLAFQRKFMDLFLEFPLSL